MWTMAILEQYFFIIYSPRIHVDDGYSRTVSFYHLCEFVDDGYSHSIFLSSILHEFMWTMATLK